MRYFFQLDRRHMAAISNTTRTNNQVRTLYDRMNMFRDHINNQLIYIRNELYPTIHNTYRLKIEESSNAQERMELIRVGEEEKARAGQNLFDSYNRLYIGLSQLLDVPQDKDTIHIIEPVVTHIRTEIRKLDKLLKQFRDTYRPRGRLNINKLTYRNERNRSPVRNETRRGRNRNRNNSNVIRARARSIIRDPSRPRREERIRISPVAFVRETNAIGSRGNMTFSSAEIGEISNKAYKNVKKTYGSMRQFKLASDAATVAAEAAQIAAEAAQASQQARARSRSRSPNRRGNQA